MSNSYDSDDDVSSDSHQSGRSPVVLRQLWDNLGGSSPPPPPPPSVSGQKIPPHVLELFELMFGGGLNLEDGRAVRKYMMTYKDDRMMNEVTAHVTKMRKLVVHMTMSGVFDKTDIDMVNLAASDATKHLDAARREKVARDSEMAVRKHTLEQLVDAGLLSPKSDPVLFRDLIRRHTLLAK